MTYIQTTCNVDCHRPLLSLFFLLSILWSSNIYSIWVLLSMLHYNRTTQWWLTFRRQVKSTTTVCTLLQHCFKLGGRDYLLLYKLHSALQPPSSNSTTSAMTNDRLLKTQLARSWYIHVPSHCRSTTHATQRLGWRMPVIRMARYF